MHMIRPNNLKNRLSFFCFIYVNSFLITIFSFNLALEFNNCWSIFSMKLIKFIAGHYSHFVKLVKCLKTKINFAPWFQIYLNYEETIYLGFLIDY